jgi:hypothetical protein
MLCIATGVSSPARHFRPISEQLLTGWIPDGLQPATQGRGAYDANPMTGFRAGWQVSSLEKSCVPFILYPFMELVPAKMHENLRGQFRRLK